MKIPKNRDLIIALAIRAKAGATSVGTAVGLAQHNAARITADLEDQIGEPGSLTNTGKQGQYNQKHAALTAARAARRSAIAVQRKLCAAAVDGLKFHLGRQWNPQWVAAGFGGNTISISRANVTARLVELRNYFRDHPAREIASEGLTAAAFETAMTAMQTAEHGCDTAVSEFRDARDARDVSAQNLKSRLSGLQEELGRLLSDDDSRWAEFGFTRPIDGLIPSAVKGLTATPGLPSTLLVQWEASARAINYRVSWSLAVSEAEVTEVGLFVDRAVTLSGLPSGAMVTVYVTARNSSGETSATKIDVRVP